MKQFLYFEIYYKQPWIPLSIATSSNRNSNNIEVKSKCKKAVFKNEIKKYIREKKK